MAKKANGSSSSTSSRTRSTPVRNSAIPKRIATTGSAPSIAPKAPPPRQVTHQMIAERAYFISQSANAGTPDENWHRAERELRGAR